MLMEYVVFQTICILLFKKSIIHNVEFIMNDSQCRSQK